MKLKKLIGLFLFVLLFTGFIIADAHAQPEEALTGRQIMEKQRDIHGASSEIELQKMLLIDSQGNKKIRSLKRYSLETGEDEYKYLLVFIEPRDIRATTLLTWQHKENPDDQWLYLPALGKRLKRIASGSKKSYFMGTDYTYEDLSPPSLSDFNYKRLGDTVYRDSPCFLLEATPTSDTVAAESGYSKRQVFIRKDVFFTVKVDYYNKRNKHVKTQEIMEIKNIGGERYRAVKSVMDNFDRNHKTLVLIDKQKVEVPIPPELFTEREVLKEIALNREDL